MTGMAERTDSSGGNRTRGRDVIRALLVEDNAADARLLREELTRRSRAPVELVTVPTLQHAITQLGETAYDVVLLDLGLPDAPDEGPLGRVLEAAPKVPVVVLTGLDDMGTAQQALEGGAQDYLIKGQVDGELLYRSMRYAVERQARQAEREAMTANMVQLQHRAALGTLAAGVAHEINNPLVYIQGGLDLAMQQLSDLRRRLARDSGAASEIAQIRASLELVRSGTERIENIVRDVLTMSRPAPMVARATSVPRAVGWAVNVARKQITTYSSLDIEVDPVPPALADETRLGQVVLNLLLNTAHAFHVADTENNHVQVRVYADRDEVVVEVSDNGIGLSEPIKERMFDPFFTTRPATQSTGLGLFIVSNAVRQFGGSIEVDSAPGEGATFRVRLPEAHGEVSGEDARQIEMETRRAAGPPPPRASAPPARATEPEGPRVLVIDDDEGVLNMLQRRLSVHCQVAAERDAREALHRWIDKSEEFDFVLCDLVMPGMSGKGFYDAVRERRADLAERIIFMTGGACTQESVDFLSENANPCLYKPFALDDLWAAMDEVRERRGQVIA